jgi:hypothetical protein
MYKYIREYFENIRQKEEKAIINKKIASRRGAAKAIDIATEVIEEIKLHHPYLFRRYDPDFIDLKKPFVAVEVPPDCDAEVHSDMFIEHGVRFSKGKKTLSIVPTQSGQQAILVQLVASSGRSGFPAVPRDPDECTHVTREFRRYVKERDRVANALVEERISDDRMRAEVYSIVVHALTSGR